MVHYIQQLLADRGGVLSAQIWFLGDNDSQTPTQSELVAVDEFGIVRVERGAAIASPWHQIEAINFGDMKRD